MTRWHAVVPIKPVAARKTRLRGCLSPDEIAALTERMLHHVLNVLGQVEAIETVTLLAGGPVVGWSGDWFPDAGGGLNPALTAVAAAIPQRLVILHADLPALDAEGVNALIAAAGTGSALAPDRRGIGTNALALADARGFNFAFGPDSFAKHCAVMPGGCVVRRRALALDIDEPDDLLFAIRQGILPELARVPTS